MAAIRVSSLQKKTARVIKDVGVRVAEEHKKTGRPLIIWKDGKVVRVQPKRTKLNSTKIKEVISTIRNQGPIFSNVRTFYAIAKNSFNEMKNEEKKHKRPKTNGESGHILTFDPDQKSFKNAFMTIVFCGVCLDALLHMLVVSRLSSNKWEEIDKKTYEEKLHLLGCNDQNIIEACKEFRHCRNEVVHEKAYFDTDKLRIAQSEAEKSVKLLDNICQYFQVKLS